MKKDEDPLFMKVSDWFSKCKGDRRYVRGYPSLRQPFIKMMVFESERASTIFG